MQAGSFPNGDRYVHKVFLADSKRKFSVWYSAEKVFQNAEAIDAKGRSYPPTEKQKRALCRLFGLTEE